jgi:hypothetical protein
MNMNEIQENTTNIEIVFCQPKTIEKYCYQINNSKLHIITKEKLIDFLKTLIPEKLKYIHELMKDNLPFIVLVDKKEVKELKFDKEKEFKKIVAEQKTTKYKLENNINKEIESKRQTDFKQFDNLNRYLDRILKLGEEPEFDKHSKK